MKYDIRTSTKQKQNTMNHTLTVENRGLYKVGEFTHIIVFNWNNQVDMMKWDDKTARQQPYMPDGFTVAIFKIKWKQ